MANRHRQAARNSQTERMCPVCNGDGYLVRNDGPRYGFGPDPQHDHTVPCSNEQCMDGWVRWPPLTRWKSRTRCATAA